MAFHFWKTLFLGSKASQARFVLNEAERVSANDDPINVLTFLRVRIMEMGIQPHMSPGGVLHDRYERLTHMLEDKFAHQYGGRCDNGDTQTALLEEGSLFLKEAMRLAEEKSPFHGLTFLELGPRRFPRLKPILGVGGPLNHELVRTLGRLKSMGANLR
jgi:hypothetical protein